MLHSPIKFVFPTSLITSLKARRRVHPGARASLNRDNPGKTNDPNLELSGFPDIVKKRIESDQTGKHRAGLECYLRNVSERGSRGTPFVPGGTSRTDDVVSEQGPRSACRARTVTIVRK